MIRIKYEENMYDITHFILIPQCHHCHNTQTNVFKIVYKRNADRISVLRLITLLLRKRGYLGKRS